MTLLFGKVEWDDPGDNWLDHLHFASTLFHHCCEFYFKQIMSPGVNPTSFSTLSSTRWRMSGPNPRIQRPSSCECAFSMPRFVSAYSRNQDSFKGVFWVGKHMIDADEDVQGQVGVVGGFEGMWVIDATLEMICEICARSPDTPWIFDVTEVEPDLEWCIYCKETACNSQDQTLG